MRTIRTVVVVLGVLVSGAGVAGPRQIGDPGFLPAALFALFGIKGLDLDEYEDDAD